MRRIPVLLSILAIVLLGLFAMGHSTNVTRAQQATPSAGDDESAPPPGVTFEFLGVGSVDALPPAPADLGLYRLTLASGAAFPVDASDPSLALVYVESGTLTVAVDVPLSILRGASVAGGEFAQDAIAAGAEATVGAGDSFIGPAYAGGELRNDGTEPAVFLLAGIEPQIAEATPVS